MKTKTKIMLPTNKIIFFILCLFSINLCFAQEDISTRLISKELLIKDLEVLKYNLENAHAGLNNYTSKEDMDAFFEDVKSQINRDMTSPEFYKIVAPLTPKIKNGHSFLVPAQVWETMIDDVYPILPFEIYHNDNTIYILRNLSPNPAIKPGTIIKSINGKSAIEIFDYMTTHWIADGNNRTRPAKIIEEDFNILYPHFYGITELFDLELTDSNGKDISVQIKGIKKKILQEKLVKDYNEDITPWYLKKIEPLTFKIEGKTATLKVTNFSTASRGDNKKKYKKFQKEAFQKIKDEGVENLILDLRGNGGGSVGPQLALLKHIINQPFELYKDVYTVTKKLPNPNYYELDLLSRIQFKLGFKSKKENGVHKMRKLPGFNGKPCMPSPNVFTGKLIVLIDGWSFSATGEVAGIIKEYRKDAIFVGEETGGNPVVNASGIQTFMTLPHSKVRMLICLVNYINNVSFENTAQGVIPDYPIKNDIEDELNGRDAAMEWVIDYLNK